MDTRLAGINGGVDMNREHLLDLFSRIQKDEKPGHFHQHSRVLLVDGMNTFLRSFAKVSRMNLAGHEVGGIVGFLKSIGYAIKLLNPTKVVIVFDGEAGSSNRKYLYPEYKAKRSTGRMMNYKSFQNKEEEDDSKYNQIVRLVDYLSYLPVLNISIDKLEADDVISNLASTTYKDYEDSEVFIMSSDNDFLQLVNDRVKVYSPTKKKIYQVQDVVEEFGVHPNNFLIYKSLIGDESDNIPGVNGLGDKNTPKLFEFLKEDKRRELKDIYEYCENTDKKSKLYQKVLNISKSVELYYKIMNLREPNISEDSLQSIKEQYYSKTPMLKKYDFLKLYSHDMMGDSISNLEVWLNLFSVLNSYN